MLRRTFTTMDDAMATELLTDIFLASPKQAFYLNIILLSKDGRINTTPLRSANCWFLVCVEKVLISWLVHGHHLCTTAA